MIGSIKVTCASSSIASTEESRSDVRDLFVAHPTPPKRENPPRPVATPPRRENPPRPAATPPRRENPPRPAATPPRRENPPRPAATPPRRENPPRPAATPPRRENPPRPAATPPRRGPWCPITARPKSPPRRGSRRPGWVQRCPTRLGAARSAETEGRGGYLKKAPSASTIQRGPKRLI